MKNRMFIAGMLGAGFAYYLWKTSKDDVDGDVDTTPDTVVTTPDTVVTTPDTVVTNPNDRPPPFIDNGTPNYTDINNYGGPLSQRDSWSSFDNDDIWSGRVQV